MGMLQHIWIDVIFISFSSPSPSSKHKQVAVQEEGSECRDEFSSGSIAGSLASGSSGFGSLSKKRAPVFPSGVSFITSLICCLLHYSFVSQDSVTAMFVRSSSGFFNQQMWKQAYLLPGMCVVYQTMHNATVLSVLSLRQITFLHITTVSQYEHVQLHTVKFDLLFLIFHFDM
jgi:hypothetical protein